MIPIAICTIRATASDNMCLLLSWSLNLSCFHIFYCVFNCPYISKLNVPITLFGHLVRMDESADASRILTAVPRVGGEGQLGEPTPPGWPL